MSGNKWDACTYKAHNSLLYKHTCAMFMIMLITSTGKNSVLSNISLIASFWFLHMPNSVLEQVISDAAFVMEKVTWHGICLHNKRIKGSK